MKIWMLNATFFPAQGGIESYLYSVGKVLLNLGHQPHIICRRHHPSLPELEEREGMTIIRHPDFPVRRGRLLRKPAYLTEKLARWIEDSGRVRDGLVISRHLYYQAAVASLPEAPPQIYLPASCWPRLMAVMSASWSFKEALFARLWRSQILRIGKRALFGAPRVMVLSRNLKDQLEILYGKPGAEIEVNPPGVDSERFSPGERDPELSRQFGLAADAPNLLFIGRLSAEKNLLFLIRSAAPLLRSRPGKLLIVGEGPEKSRLRKEIRRNELGDKVILAGGTDHPERFYRLGDIFVSPSRYESFGQTLLEAAASGLPIVALRGGRRIQSAAEEIVREGRTGFCPRTEEFRGKLRILLDNPELRRRMGASGREVCRTEFTWERHVTRLLRPGEGAGGD